MEELKLNLVPDIENLRPAAKKDILSRALEGDFTTLFKGKGMEFAGYREYSYTDDASTIDWSASLRSKKTLVREYEVQKNFSIFLMLDVSDKMLFTSTKKNKLKVEHGAELLNKIAYAAIQANNAVGMGMFADGLVTRIWPNIGTGQMARINRELRHIQNYGGKCNVKRALVQTNTYLKQRTLIIIISDFVGMEAGWTRMITGLREAHEVMGLAVRDPRDEEFPAMTGQFVLQDPNSDEKMLIDISQYKKIYKDQVIKDDQHIRHAFGAAHSFIKLRTDKDMTHPLMNLFERRARIYNLM